MRFLIVLIYLLSTLPVHATLNDVDKTQIYNKNLLKNGGFENGKQYWTPNDSADFTTSTSSPLEGLVMGLWDADASADTLVTTAVTIPAGMYGRNSVASCLFVTASGTATHEIQAYDGSNVLSEATITSSTTPSRASTNFIMPSSGSIQLRVYANADEPEIKIDSCFLGPAEGYNVGSVSQAQFAGESYFAGTTNCTGWTRTSTTVGAVSSDADCPGPTVISSYLGTWATTDSNLPRQTITNLPPGKYKATFYVGQVVNVASGVALAIYDGETTCYGLQGNNSITTVQQVVSCFFNYTTAGDREFEIYVASSANTVTLNNNGTTPAYGLRFQLERYPTTQETSYTTDKLANSWSGYHDDTCVWARTNTALGDPTADATCTFTERTNANFGTVTSYLSGSDKLPGIVFTPSRAGRYFVKASPMFVWSTSSYVTVQLLNGSTVVDSCTKTQTSNGYGDSCSLSGIVVATSTSAITLKIQTAASAGTVTIEEQPLGANTGAAVEWSIFQIDQSFPAPLIANSVVSPSSGVVGLASAVVSNSGVVSSETGDWINGSAAVSDTSVFTITFNNGVWATAPVCTATVINNTTANNTLVKFDSVVTTTTAVIRTYYNTTASNFLKAALDFYIICVGAK